MDTFNFVGLDVDIQPPLELGEHARFVTMEGLGSTTAREVAEQLNRSGLMAGPKEHQRYSKMPFFNLVNALDGQGGIVFLDDASYEHAKLA